MNELTIGETMGKEMAPELSEVEQVKVAAFGLDKPEVDADSGYTPSEIHVAKIIANAASDWVDRCDSDDHALEHSNWEAYISEARAIEAVIREDERQKAIDTIRFHRGGYNRNGSSHKLLLKMEDAILSQSFTGTEKQK